MQPAPSLAKISFVALFHLQAGKRANALNSMIENEGDSLSKNTKYLLWNLLCPEDIMSRGNKAIKSRTDTAKNPLGGLSLAAG